ncbi:MAG: hypothetical protein A3C80_02335 [Candidatus Ryanbacteria bacterium RIFCSPHIGHO2_02_FULL_45_43]|uniref:Uncharacterized protein n=1 Tax=Candidatus Ryanbacteria bacterium RIFCSPHIGHO2_01_45_13 TaxID=1802112 RepID=A0A1G2FWK2_9BACT|nr:MAG: hypothetical protein A2718_00765 [Candidatus Ryanbacteria bacterium RIFCSPHIGHO2_01_FULL_44_130]OGZ42443.1 MAG: hypothetical protein A2W41_03610 [Candidatus Ryanbacteria bacterium RIFCSPHIGHO2_01_45_13]OGZ48460.1 MAG: hypothetical protein A3C80_02335 [Candidatus Ryanbacteria bacterium RIFCSPHIGHO2_02_FULL_45_43]OGZ50325.1 MAG: hypothetical protein A3E55_00235 [Candidatus Ryanbacteria bacterium RIFCSPHIGHO2_12_FULL_44_20]OGZ51664.1 MAG: hypothetical protein A3A17_02685 [Candidatus Ryanba
MKWSDVVVKLRRLIKNFLRFSVAFLLFVLGLAFVVFSVKLIIGFVLFDWYVERLVSTFALDTTLARWIAAYATLTTILFSPMFLWWWLARKKAEIFTTASVIFLLGGLWLVYGSRTIVYRSDTGEPMKCYLKTLDGFKLASRTVDGTCPYDQETGVRFKEFEGNKSAAIEYKLWRKTRKLGIPDVECNNYFDMLTGKGIVWYGFRDPGTIALFSLPGFDPSTGSVLKTITPEMLTSLTSGEYLVINGISGKAVCPTEQKVEQKALEEDLEKATQSVIALESELQETRNQLQKARSEITQLRKETDQARSQAAEAQKQTGKKMDEAMQKAARADKIVRESENEKTLESELRKNYLVSGNKLTGSKGGGGRYASLTMRAHKAFLAPPYLVVSVLVKSNNDDPIRFMPKSAELSTGDDSIMTTDHHFVLTELEQDWSNHYTIYKDQTRILFFVFDHPSVQIPENGSIKVSFDAETEVMKFHIPPFKEQVDDYFSSESKFVLASSGSENQ